MARRRSYDQFCAVARALDQVSERWTLLIVRNGRAVLKNMQAELLSMEDLQSQLRQQGVESVREVKRAYLESDGRLSVITYKDHPARSGARDRAP